MKPTTKLLKLRRLEHDIKVLESRKVELLEVMDIEELEIIKKEESKNRSKNILKIVEIRCQIDRKPDLELSWIVKQLGEIEKIRKENGLSEDEVADWLKPRSPKKKLASIGMRQI